MHQRLPGTAVLTLDALASMPGEHMKLRAEGQDDVDATVTAAVVDDDGRGYRLELEIPDGLVPVLDEVEGVTWTVDP